MRISNNSVTKSSPNQNFQVRTNRANTVQKDYNAYRVELSIKALNSPEYNSSEQLFPIHNTEALQYTQNIKIIYK